MKLTFEGLEVAEVLRMKLEPGDVIVVKLSAQGIESEEAEQIRKMVSHVVQGKHPVMVVDGSIDISTLQARPTTVKDVRKDGAARLDARLGRQHLKEVSDATDPYDIRRKA